MSISYPVEVAHAFGKVIAAARKVDSFLTTPGLPGPRLPVEHVIVQANLEELHEALVALDRLPDPDFSLSSKQETKLDKPR